CRFHADKPCLRATYCLTDAPFLDSHKGRIGRTKRIGIAGGRVRHEAAARAARLACAEGPPVGGTFQFQIFIQTPSPEICSEIVSSGDGGCWRGSRVACFWATSFRKKFIYAGGCRAYFAPSRARHRRRAHLRRAIWILPLHHGHVGSD